MNANGETSLWDMTVLYNKHNAERPYKTIDGHATRGIHNNVAAIVNVAAHQRDKTLQPKTK